MNFLNRAPTLDSWGGGGRKRGTNFNIDIYRELFKNRLLKTAICEFIIQAPLKIVDSYVIKKVIPGLKLWP